MVFRTWLPLLLALLALPAVAHEYDLGPLHIGHPYARPTPPGATTGAAYFSITNKATTTDKLVRASTPRAQGAELHSMSMEGNIMRMRQVQDIAAIGGDTVKLEPGGYHLMLTGLKQPLKVGERFPLTLYFEKAGRVTVDIVVQDAATGEHAGHDGHAAARK
jgi:copper(I)-binding protein